MACEYFPCVTWRPQWWYPCSTYFGTCGFGTQQRKFSCMSANNQSTQRSLCEDSSGVIDNLFPLNERERSCKVPCDAETQYTKWSEWGLCRRDCSTKLPAERDSQFRSRTSFIYTKNTTKTMWEKQTCSPGYCYTYKKKDDGCYRLQDDRKIDIKFCDTIVRKAASIQRTERTTNTRKRADNAKVWKFEKMAQLCPKEYKNKGSLPYML